MHFQRTFSLYRFASRPAMRLAAVLTLLVAALAFLPAIAQAQGPPGTPLDVSVTRSDGTLHVGWKATKGATSYHITYTSNGGQSWSLGAYGHTSTRIDIGGVDNSKTYIVGVRALNEHGGSSWRNSAPAGPFTPPATSPPPATPSWINVARADGTLSVTWQAVFNATSYHITYTSNNGQSWNLAASNHTESSINIGGTPNSLTYIVAVRAGNQHGWSSWRNSAPAGPYTPPATPSHPYDLRAAGGDRSVTLTWSNPINSTITHYMYQYRAAPPAAGWSAWKAIANSDANTTHFVKSGLTNGTEYRFKLRAVNAYGASAPAPNAAPWYVAAIPSGGVGVPPPPKPTPAPGAPASVTVTRSYNALAVSWDASSGATSYQIMYSSDGEASWTYASRNHTSTSIAISNISQSATYVVAVSARNNNGSSPYSKSAPIAPPALSAGDVGKTSATLTLNNFTDDWHYKADTGPDSTCQGPVSTASKALTGLTSGAQYTYTAYRTGGASPCGGSRAIDTVTFTTLSTPGARDSGKDITLGSGNDDPLGVWSDGTTMWVMEYQGTKVFAYKMSDGSRDSAKDITRSSSAILGQFITADGTTMWLSDITTSTKLYGHSVANKNADSSKDFTLHADNGTPRGLYTDGTTMWVHDYSDDKIYAYVLSSGARDSGKDITLHTDNDSATGIWADGTTMWVADSADDKVYAYRMSDGSRDSAKDYDGIGSYLLTARGIWSDGTTMWIADASSDKIFAHHAFKVQMSVSDTAVTSATLTMGNHTSDWYYKADGGPDSTCQGPVSEASEALTGLTAATEYTYTAYSASGCGSATEIASTTFTTLATPGARDSGKDFDTLTAAGNNSPDGIWSNGTTMWVQDYTDKKAYAYNLTTKARDSGKDVSLSDANNASPVALGSDGTTMWSADSATDDKLFAYTISGNTRDTSKDISLHTDNTDVGGLWANSATIWVGDWADEYIYAYTISGGARDSGKEIDLHADNATVIGLWSDGVTMWVSDSDDSVLYAYRMSDGSRDSSKDYTLDSANSDAFSIWSDGITMWVADDGDDKLYAYHAFTVQLNASDIAAATATLTLTNYREDWYYKADAGPDNTCQGPVSATSEALSGLTAATEYTYTAYSAGGDSPCASANEIAAATFTTNAATTSLTATGISGTGATLNMTGYTSAWSYKRTAGPASTTCSDISAGTTTATLSSLTADTLYGYTSYSGSGCTTALYTVYFSTTDFDVGNLAEANANPNCLVGRQGSASQKCAIAFTTGSRAGGYTLKNLSARFGGSIGSPGNIIVKIHAASGNDPGTEVVTLTNSSNDPDTAGLYTYPCSGSDCDLAANTKYFVVMSTGDTSGLTLGYYWGSTTSNDETSHPSGNNWSIADSGRYKHGNAAWSNWTSNAAAHLHIAANDATVRFSASSVTSTSATLTISGNSGSWYYKYTSPTGGTCSAAQSGQTASVTNLTGSTTYTFKAYSASGCASANEIASTTFTTLAAGITATGITGTGATLNMTGYASAWSYKRTAGPADTTCSDISAGTTTATLSSLTADTLYGYTSYSGSGCTTANELYTVHFSTTDYGVGNLDETVSASCAVGHVTDANQCAVAFTTGARSGGYTLASITAGFNVREGSPGDLPNIASITVAIHAADTTDSSNPAATAIANATLSGSDPDTAGLYTYTCSGTGCALSASTTYFVVMSTTDTSGLRWYVLRTTPSDVETAHPAANGWSIANVGRFKQGSAAWVDYGNSRTPLLHIAADDAP